MTTTESKIDHPVFGTILTRVEELAAGYSNLDAQLKAAEGDQDAALKAWVDSTDDPAAVKLRDQIAMLTAKLNERANAALAKSEMSEEDKEAKLKELAAAKDSFRDAVSAATKLAKALNFDETVLREALDKIGDPTRSGRGRPVGSAGNSGPRASVMVYVSGPAPVEGEKPVDQDFESFSAAAKATRLDLVKLQEAYASAGGVKLDDISSIKEPKEFKVGEFVVKTRPKTRKNAAK